MLFRSRRLLIDNDAETSLNIGYVYDLTDVSIMPATFQIHLATEMAFAVVQKLCTGAIVSRTAGKVLPARLAAQAANGKSNPPKKYQQSSMITGRRRYQG